MRAAWPSLLRCRRFLALLPLLLPTVAVPSSVHPALRVCPAPLRDSSPRWVEAVAISVAACPRSCCHECDAGGTSLHSCHSVLRVSQVTCLLARFKAASCAAHLHSQPSPLLCSCTALVLLLHSSLRSSSCCAAPVGRCPCPYSSRWLRSRPIPRSARAFSWAGGWVSLSRRAADHCAADTSNLPSLHALETPSLRTRVSCAENHKGQPPSGCIYRARREAALGLQWRHCAWRG